MGRYKEVPLRRYKDICEGCSRWISNCADGLCSCCRYRLKRGIPLTKLTKEEPRTEADQQEIDRRIPIFTLRASMGLPLFEGYANE